ncbi:hypothetical protein [Leuconostoc carnosum]|uniref:hypothetical protein n=1 Tax=Leuconostoc carnosum TaxID=1252 RepID=UPI00388BB7C3
MNINSYESYRNSDFKDLAQLLNNINYDSQIHSIQSLLDVFEVYTWISNPDIVMPSIDKSYFECELKKYIGKSIGEQTPDGLLDALITNGIDAQGKLPLLYDMYSVYNLWSQVSFLNFRHLMDSEYVDLHFILGDKKLVRRFDEILYNYLRTNTKNIFNIFLLVRQKILGDNNLFLPRNFRNNDSFQIVLEHYLSNIDNIGFTNRDIILLDFIRKFKNTAFPVDAPVRLQVEKIIEDYWQTQEPSTKNAYGFEFITATNISAEFVVDKEMSKFIVNKSWLDSLAEDTLLFYIIDQFTVDSCQRPNIISDLFIAKKDLGFIESFKDISDKENYENIFKFEGWKYLVDVAITGFEDYLTKRGTTFELLFSDYFNIQINSQFEISGFSMEIIDPSLSIDIRIKLLCIELESLIKQFDLFTKYERIDLRALKYTNPLDFSEVQSLKKDKYVSVDREKLFRSNHFSVQEKNVFIFFSYVEKVQISKNFYARLDSEDIISDVSSTLFSRQELAYLNFTLNNKEYSDSLAIRNMYLHGSTKHLSKQEHHMNYIHVLTVFLITISEIDSEFFFIHQRKLDLLKEQTKGFL